MAADSDIVGCEMHPSNHAEGLRDSCDTIFRSLFIFALSECFISTSDQASYNLHHHVSSGLRPGITLFPPTPTPSWRSFFFPFFFPPWQPPPRVEVGASPSFLVFFPFMFLQSLLSLPLLSSSNSPSYPLDTMPLSFLWGSPRYVTTPSACGSTRLREHDRLPLRTWSTTKAMFLALLRIEVPNHPES